MSKKCFTLVELIIVIAIIGILSVSGVLIITKWISKSRDATKISSIKTITTAIELNYVRKEEYPMPSEAKEYTGVNGIKMYQGYVGGNMVAELPQAAIDPTTKKPYVYSYMKLKGGQGYYQIGTTMENIVGYVGYEKVRAEGDSKKAKVVGNYKFDPSLPSLIIAGGNESTGGIYDPATCFVVDGGENTVDGTYCQSKKDVSMKEYDGGLIGYWDMESYYEQNGKFILNDISGNDNNGVLTGGLNPLSIGTLTGGIIGKGLYFNGDLNHIVINNSESLNPKKITISAIANFYGTGVRTHYYPRILGKGITGLPSEQYALWQIVDGDKTPEKKNFQIRLSTDIVKTTQVNGINNYDINKFIFITFTYDGNETKIYVNGKLDILDNNIFKGDIKKSSNNLLIGNTSWSNGLTRAFFGIIDEVKIYNRVLTDEEILQQAKVAGF